VTIIEERFSYENTSEINKTVSFPKNQKQFPYNYASLCEDMGRNY